MSMLFPFSFPAVTYGITISFLVSDFSSMPPPSRFEQEPGAAFGFVDPDFDQARGRDIAMLVANVVRLAQTRGQSLVVLRQFSKHIQGLDILGVVIEHALGPRDLSARSQRDSARLAHALRDWIGHRKKLVGLFVQEQVVVAKMRTAHVPVEIFRLHIKREKVWENRVHGAGNVLYAGCFHICPCR